MVYIPISDTANSGYKKISCKESGSGLCIDKTFNLGEFNVTLTVYMDLSVARLRTDDHPL